MTPRPPEPPKDWKIRTRGLTRTFTVDEQIVTALDGIDLDINAGEFFCIVGPSGCGKTTLLRIIAGLETGSSGSIEVRRDSNGAQDAGTESAPRPLNSMVFQEHSIFPWMTVLNNVAFGLKARGQSKEERYRVAREYIDKVHLNGFETALPHQLSGGMRQRVSIARAFANDPEMLLMDEPFGALDEQTKLILQGELLRMWDHDKKTVLYVTHSIDEAILLADRILVMTARPGRIKDILNVSDHLSRPREISEVKSQPQFGELFARVWGQLEDEVLAASQVGRADAGVQEP